MDHCAIDLGGRESQICVRDSEGKIIEERRCATASLGGYLKKRLKSRVILETCSEAFAIAKTAKSLGHEVRVVPASVAPSLGVGARRIKTDTRDARILSEVSCRIDLGSVHIPTETASELKTLCNMREGLIGTRTKLINTVRGWVRCQVWRLRSGAVETFPNRVREVTAKEGREVPAYVGRVLKMIESLNGEIREADKELRIIAQGNETCRKLMTVPGVGPVTSVRFLAAVDDVKRFSSAHQLESYFGLSPGERSSSERKERTGITRAGSPKVRWTLVEAAWIAWRRSADLPLGRWAEDVAKRRGRRIAAVAVARKLAGILFAIWRDGTTYDPKRAAWPQVLSAGD